MKEHPILHALHFHGVPMSDQKQSQFGKASKSKNNIFFAETDDFAGVTAQVVGGNNDVNRLYARRIVACVNACAGYSTEDLEQATLDKLHRHEIIADLVKSNKQRDELEAEVVEMKLIIASDTGTESAVANLQQQVSHMIDMVACEKSDAEYFKKQRDELLAALESMVSVARLTIGWSVTPANADGPLAVAEKLIYSVKGCAK